MTTEELVLRLSKHRLLGPERLRELTSLYPQYPDVDALGKELLRRGWLTPLQTRWLLRGRVPVVEQYALLDRLGEGGMGEVFLARHRHLHRLTALKTIRPEMQTRKLVQRRFLREVRALALVNHVNVVHAYDAGVVRETCYLAMEYAPGPTLGWLVRTVGPLDPALACGLARQAALGLGHLHGHGIIHRDVKPDNLSLAHGGQVVKVLDVGLARVREAAADDLTRAGGVLGSMDYVSPEQVRDPRSVDARSDLYSLGCTLYFLLTGQVPFPEGTKMAKAMQQTAATARPVEELRPEVPARVAAVVRRLMAKRPEDRFPTADEAAAALAAAAPGHSTQADAVAAMALNWSRTAAALAV